MAPHSQPRSDSLWSKDGEFSERAERYQGTAGTPTPLQAPQPQLLSRSALLRSPLPQPSGTSTPQASTSAAGPQETPNQQLPLFFMHAPPFSRPGTTTSWKSARQSSVRGGDAQSSPMQHRDQPFHVSGPQSPPQAQHFQPPAPYCCYPPSPQSPSGQSHRSGHAQWGATRPQSPPQSPLQARGTPQTLPRHDRAAPFPPNGQSSQSPSQSPTVGQQQQPPPGSSAPLHQYAPAPAGESTAYSRCPESQTPYIDHSGHSQPRDRTVPPQRSGSRQSQSESLPPPQLTPHQLSHPGTPMPQGQPPYQTTSWPPELQEPGSRPDYPPSQGQSSFPQHSETGQPQPQSSPQQQPTSYPSSSPGTPMPQGQPPYQTTSWPPKFQQPGSHPDYPSAQGQSTFPRFSASRQSQYPQPVSQHPDSQPWPYPGAYGPRTQPRGQTPFSRPAEFQQPDFHPHYLPWQGQTSFQQQCPESWQSQYQSFSPQQPEPHPSPNMYARTPAPQAQPHYQTPPWATELGQSNVHAHHASPHGPTHPDRPPSYALDNGFPSPEGYPPQQTSQHGRQEPPPQHWQHQQQPSSPYSPTPPHHYPEATPVASQRYSPEAQTGPLDLSRRAGNDNNNGMVLDRQKSQFAIQLQQASDVVLRDLKKNIAFSDVGWADVLTIAPRSISIMSILFKTSASKAAAGMRVGKEQRKITDTNDYLPSEYFHTNLVACGNLGRIAFVDAEKEMGIINAIAADKISEYGSIPYILNLLKDPEEARQNLGRELEVVREDAKTSLGAAERIKKKFWDWYLFIQTLEQVCSHIQNETNAAEERVKHGRTEKEKQKEDKEHERRRLEKRIRDLNADLELAKEDVREAHERLQDEINSTLSANAQTRKDTEEAMKLFKASEHFGGSLFKPITGITRKTIDEQRNEYIRRKAKEREDARTAAAQHVERCERRVQAIKRNIYAARKGLGEKTESLEGTQNELVELVCTLSRLESKADELKAIQEILDKSAKNLMDLKSNVENLVVFFRKILSDVDRTLKLTLTNFLSPIENAIKHADKNGAAMQLGRASERRVLQSAFALQTSFAAIETVSSTYIDVSSQHIRPTLNRMEALDKIKTDLEWHRESEAFMVYCEERSKQIGAMITGIYDVRLEREMRESAGTLRRSAIEG